MSAKYTWLDLINSMILCRKSGHRWGQDEPFCLRCGTRRRKSDMEARS